MDLDHIVIAAADLDASVKHYEALFAVLGFEKSRDRVWHNSQGVFIEVRAARDAAYAYKRQGVGVNHFGVKASSRDEVDAVVAKLRAAGVAAPDPQTIDTAYAVFIPDPDGLRLEIGFDP